MLSLFQEEQTAPPKKKKKIRTYKPKDPKKVSKAIRSQSKCTDCGWKKVPAILEFHHVEEGNREPTRTRRSRTVQPQSCSTIEQMEGEYEKGFYLCPTCHTLRHYNEEMGVMDTANKNLR